MVRPSLLVVLWVCGTVAPITTARGDAPNIVIILADDLGVGDVQAHYPANKIATPHLDQLVREGMSFTDAHSPSAVCSPTRYGLLTGRYAWRTRLQEWVIAAYEPPLIAADRPTLPGLLRTRGYTTACIGKWHLGWEWPGPQQSRMTQQPNGQASLEWDFSRAIGGGPTQRGFDRFFGVDLPNLPPFTFIENDHVLVPPTDRYMHDPSEGVVLPKNFEGCPMAPGWRFQNILPEITRRAVACLHDLAGQDKPFLLYFSLTSPHEPVVPSPEFQGKSGINPIADFVMETDWSVGQVLRAIDELGVADDTIVIFTADNGHSHYTGWEGLVAAGHMPSGPYRGHKGDIWEGGHRVPFIARWPGHIPAESQSSQLVCLTDLFATCAELVGADLPQQGAEDSFSFLPVLLGTAVHGQRTHAVHHSNHGEFAYRAGPWKLVFKKSSPDLSQARGQLAVVELYHLEDDIAEQQDVSAERPEVVQRLTDELAAVVAGGASRSGAIGTNDTPVRFDTIQKERWAEE